MPSLPLIYNCLFVVTLIVFPLRLIAFLNCCRGPWDAIEVLCTMSAKECGALTIDWIPIVGFRKFVIDWSSFLISVSFRLGSLIIFRWVYVNLLFVVHLNCSLLNLRLFCSIETANHHPACYSKGGKISVLLVPINPTAAAKPRL